MERNPQNTRLKRLTNRVKHIEAEICYLTPEEGGRRTPVSSGYRGQFYYDGSNWDAEQFFDVEPVMPKAKVKAQIWFTRPEEHRGKLWPGKEFEIREGARIVARGKVTKLLEL